ncbi:ABC transporter ATP-binding protein [Haloquadratum walsbyi]|jgi:ABC-type Fe3+/spermidine/putrescine transport system ATPase subunit|uniref:ABC transporter ATP-binding protein n=1 Tax=Haloquadratum walsbyi TaxID=293091 RepID=UPI0023F0B10F|nr:ABC transporter ATP-binding protein [Haloquadratum walsbyi]
MLEINNINKRFGELVAINDISFEVGSGELVTLVGPSGSGKSTVLDMIAGHISPTSGSIVMDGKEITEIRPQERPTSTVFQSWALFPHMSVRENIQFPIDAQDQLIDMSVEQLLKQVRLNPVDYGNKRAGELSGGEQQRVALARAIAYDPDILLLDEPLASLDYVLQKKLRRELSELNEELDITFIYVTHSLESALTMSDRIIILNNGQIVQSGRPSDIYQEPSNRFVAEFMGDANVFPLDSATGKNGSIEVTNSEFNDTFLLQPDRNVTPDYIVVRYDDAIVDSKLIHDVGIESTVYNKMIKGNRTLVKTISEQSDQEYIADMEYNEVDELSPGDKVYLQWNKDDSIIVPK